MTKVLAKEFGYRWAIKKLLRNYFVGGYNNEK